MYPTRDIRVTNSQEIIRSFELQPTTQSTLIEVKMNIDPTPLIHEESDSVESGFIYISGLESVDEQLE